MCLSHGLTAHCGFMLSIASEWTANGFSLGQFIPGSITWKKMVALRSLTRRACDWTVIISVVHFFQLTEIYSLPAPLEKKTVSETTLFRCRSMDGIYSGDDAPAVESFYCRVA